MASFEIATKANLALVLPGLVTGLYLHREHSSLLPTFTKAFHDGLDVGFKQALRMTDTEGRIWEGNAIVRHLADLVNSNISPQKGSFIQEWFDRSERFSTTDLQSLRQALYELNTHLTLRTYIAAYDLNIADLVAWATIRGNRVGYSLIKQTPNNVSRWFAYIEKSNPWLVETIAELATFEAKERAANSAAGASYKIDLPNVDGLMVTRFPPEPSGYLHIGHAKAALLNDYFAHKNKGILICRFDDTNPSKEKMEFQDAIMEDLKSMAIITEKTSYSSDYFQEIYEYALKLIQAGKAFADDSALGMGDEDRKNRLPSKRRDLSIEETLRHFSEMESGSEEGRRWCLRARIAYDSPNGTLRDPVIYRCNMTPHHRTGTEWNIYPTYDFCAPILDSIEGVTIALRTNEYRDRNVQYEWMQEVLDLRKVTIWDFSRMNLIRTVLSKRKLTRIVDDGKVWGWDDPRMPTIRGILRRGMSVPALREFILRQGPSRNILNLEWGQLWALNKKYIDPTCARHTAIGEADAVHCTVTGLDPEAPLEATKPKYIKNLDLGTKKTMFSKSIVLEQFDAQSLHEGEEITLMNWGNAFARRITRDGSIVTSIDFQLHLEGDVKKTKKITWLADVSSNMILVDLITFDYLITKDKLEKEDTLEDFLAPQTESRVQAFADCNMVDLPKNSVVQFERKGYFKLDREYRKGERLVFFDVPSGKS